MAYNSGKGTDGTDATSTAINSISLPWTTDVRPRTGAIDAAYSNDNPYYRVHGYQPIGRQRDIAPHYPITETSLSREYDDWTGGLLGASSTLALPGADGAAQPHVLEDDLSWSQFQAYAEVSQDLPAMLHQDPWHIPNFFGDVDLEAGLTEDITNFMVPEPSSSATGAHVGAGVASTEAGPSSDVPSASGHDFLLTALDTPAEGSPKKRKMQALDLESDAEDGPRKSTHGLKKCRVRNPSTPTAELEQGDIAEGSSTMNVKQVVEQKTRRSKLMSSRDYRKRTSSGIASLRERVFPGSVKKGTRRRGVAASKDMNKDETSETSELDVILEACKKIDDARENIKQLEDSNEELRNGYKKLEDYIKELEDRNKALEDNIKVPNVDYVAADRREVENYSWLFENLDSDEVRA